MWAGFGVGTIVAGLLEGAGAGPEDVLPLLLTAGLTQLGIVVLAAVGFRK